MAADGGRRRGPTLADVARLAGVSAQTVSRTATGSEYVSPETRDRVLHAMDQLGYSPNRAARALRNGHYGTIGLLAAQFALAAGAEVHVGGVREGSLALARSLGVPHTWQLDALAASASDQFDAVIEATSNEAMPALSVRLAKPAGRVVYIGLSSTPSLVDTRDVALKDITAVGILSASPGLAGAIEHFADGSVIPDSIVSEVVALEDVPARLEGRRGADAGPGPKVHVDPRLRT